MFSTVVRTAPFVSAGERQLGLGVERHCGFR
jgi:hypothetical protein